MRKEFTHFTTIVIQTQKMTPVMKMEKRFLKMHREYEWRDSINKPFPIFEYEWINYPVKSHKLTSRFKKMVQETHCKPSLQVHSFNTSTHEAVCLRPV